MKIYLPSNGMMGLTSIEMRPPRIKDINFEDLSSNETLRKTEFLQLLVDKKRVRYDNSV